MHRIAMLFLIVLTTTGCDPAVSGRQRIDITILSEPSGLPIANAHVRTVAAQRFPKSSLDKLADDSCRESTLDVNRVSDENGRVVINHPVFNIGLRLRDGVTGRDHWFRIERDTVECLRVKMTPGNTVHGERFGVRINAISKPLPNQCQ